MVHPEVVEPQLVAVLDERLGRADEAAVPLTSPAHLQDAAAVPDPLPGAAIPAADELDVDHPVCVQAQRARGVGRAQHVHEAKQQGAVSEYRDAIDLRGPVRIAVGPLVVDPVGNDGWSGQRPFVAVLARRPVLDAAAPAPNLQVALDHPAKQLLALVVQVEPDVPEAGDHRLRRPLRPDEPVVGEADVVAVSTVSQQGVATARSQLRRAHHVRVLVGAALRVEEDVVFG